MRASGPPDAWVFVVGESSVVAVPAGTDADVVGALSTATEGSPTIESLVALIPLGGDGAVASFAALVAGESVDGDGVPMTGVVRGRIAVDIYSVGGSRRFTDRGIRPWLIADFRSVTGVVIHTETADVPGVGDVGLGKVVPVGAWAATRLDWEPGSEPLPLGTTPTTPRQLADPQSELGAETAILRRDREADVRPGRESAPEAAPAPLPAPTTQYLFRIGRGEERPLDAVYLIGRKPRLGRMPTPGEDVRLVTVASPSLEVSSTHVELRRQGDAVVVTDLHSTNGTLVVPPRARRLRLRPGESLVVAPGTTVHIGDGTIITISATEAPGLPFAPTRRPTT